MRGRLSSPKWCTLIRIKPGGRPQYELRVMSLCRILTLTIILLYFSTIILFLTYQPSPFDSTVLYPPTPCKCPQALTLAPVTTPSEPATTLPKSPPTSPPRPLHTLAVMVPFRDRWEELTEFVPYMHKFLNLQNVSHEIWVINQADKHRFNRAMLMNSGFMLTESCCDYLVMHDVDLLPLNNHLSYAYPTDYSPYHISSPELHPLYHYKKFVGGILMMTREHFKKVNGLTNIFWGWGREDDELYLRIKEAGLQLHRPAGITTGNKTFRHNHDRKVRPRDMKSYGTQWRLSRRRDRESGLHTLKFEVLSIHNMSINGAPFKLANLELHCDYQKTPFCDHPS